MEIRRVWAVFFSPAGDTERIVRRIAGNLAAGLRAELCVCIKCQACVLRCPTGAKYFDDPASLSHIAMLQATVRTRQESVCCL